MLRPHTTINDEQRSDYCQKMYQIAGLGMKLYNELGPGYSEPIYQECLSILCEENQIPWEREKDLYMFFHDSQLKKVYTADFVCFGDIIVELKATRELISEHRAQLFNYLRITGLHAGVLMNFGEDERMHTEKYLYNADTNKYDLIHGNAKSRSKYYPGTNVLWDSLK